MRVPLSWLRDYVDFDLPVERLAERLTLLGMEVGSIETIGLVAATAEHGTEGIYFMEEMGINTRSITLLILWGDTIDAVALRDKIPEDWGIFFKAYYKVGGGLEVDPIYLPLHADAAQSTTNWKTMKSQYEQIRRWAWGTSDDSWIIKNYLVDTKIPFWDKTTRLGFVMWAHFMWPVNWFLITIGLTIPTLINPAFGRTALGYMVPKLSSIILTISLVFFSVFFFVDNVYKPKRPDGVSVWKAIFMPFEFVLLPIAGFFFNALPGLDAHTRLMLGKYIEYKVTEKV